MPGLPACAVQSGPTLKLLRLPRLRQATVYRPGTSGATLPIRERLSARQLIQCLRVQEGQWTRTRAPAALWLLTTAQALQQTHSGALQPS